jgi:hypothetical protein
MSRMLRVATALLATATVLLAPASAGAQIAEFFPEFFDNYVVMSASPVGVIGWGPLALTTPALPGTRVECVGLGFGGAWNVGTNSRMARAEVLGWGASGDATTRGTQATSSCKYEKGTQAAEAWVTAEAAPMEGRREPLSIPWQIELRCGEREEETAGIAKIGVPEGTTQKPRPCNLPQTEAEEAKEVESEEAERKGCYASPVPSGCVKVDVVTPSLGLEEAFDGSLRARTLNGSGNGLHPSVVRLEGAISGRLRLSTEFADAATVVGQVNVDGFGGELIQLK